MEESKEKQFTLGYQKDTPAVKIESSSDVSI